jgi:hypothetical protein
MAKFRFQDLRIWQQAIDITDKLFDVADELEKRRLYRFAEQLRGAGMSMLNNIAEGSGSSSNKEFVEFLNLSGPFPAACRVSVIPAYAGIQKKTGCLRINTFRGRLIRSGMTCDTPQLVAR